MLKNLDPLLNADVLHALRAMDHGDEFVVCGANFPIHSIARETILGKALHIDNVDTPRAVKAILSVLPLDTCGTSRTMCMIGESGPLPAVRREARAEIDAAEGRSVLLASAKRFEFHARAREAYCVIATGETRAWGYYLFTKGVIGLDSLSYSGWI